MHRLPALATLTFRDETGPIADQEDRLAADRNHRAGLPFRPFLGSPHFSLPLSCHFPQARACVTCSVALVLPTPGPPNHPPASPGHGPTCHCHPVGSRSAKIASKLMQHDRLLGDPTESSSVTSAKSTEVLNKRPPLQSPGCGIKQ